MGRIDVVLVEKGYFDSRQRSRLAVEEGYVKINGKVITKPSSKVCQEDHIEVTGDPLPFVSRGAIKLKRGVEYFTLKDSIINSIALDVGASTGGFTEICLQNGAQKVYAVDVGSGQLAERLKNDPRVVNMENTDIRTLAQNAEYRGFFDFTAIDVSFISLKLVLPGVKELMKTGSRALCLIKPQFEGGKGAVNKNGLVTSAKEREKIVKEILDFARLTGFMIQGNPIESPITGGEGNVEYLMCLRKI